MDYSLLSLLLLLLLKGLLKGINDDSVCVKMGNQSKIAGSVARLSKSDACEQQQQKCSRLWIHGWQ
jgi:hypothetical protein